LWSAGREAYLWRTLMCGASARMSAAHRGEEAENNALGIGTWRRAHRPSALAQCHPTAAQCRCSPPHPASCPPGPLHSPVPCTRPLHSPLCSSLLPAPPLAPSADAHRRGSAYGRGGAYGPRGAYGRRCAHGCRRAYGCGADGRAEVLMVAGVRCLRSQKWILMSLRSESVRPRAASSPWSSDRARSSGSISTLLSRGTG